MYTLFYILASTSIISLCSFMGLLTLIKAGSNLKKFLLYLVSFAAGTLMGGAFFHLIPEALELLEAPSVNLWVVLAFISFFLIEKVFRWHHHHVFDHEEHVVGYLSLLGDTLHNFIDGVVIATSFYTSIPLGIVTSLAVLLHEIPQEVGDFAVLMHSGFTIKKALLFNFGVAILAVLGGMVGYALADTTAILLPHIMSFAAGGFLYISAADLLPEIRQEENIKRSWFSFVLFVLGIAFMLLLSYKF